MRPDPGERVILRGSNLKSTVDRYPQNWWCVPAHLAKPPEPDPAAVRALAGLLGREIGDDEEEDAMAMVRPDYLARHYPNLGRR